MAYTIDSVREHVLISHKLTELCQL